MKPSEIIRLTNSSKRALMDSSSAPDAFLLAYVAWEGLQLRILVAGLFASGKSVSEAYRVIKDRKVWDKVNRNRLFVEVFGANPQNIKYLGKHFKKAESVKNLRDRYVHGFSRTSPQKFKDGTQILLALIEHNWGDDIHRLLKSKVSNNGKLNPLLRLRR